jgi:hypothetical protein
MGRKEGTTLPSFPIILLRYQTSIKVLKDALAHLGPYETLMEVWCNDPGGENTVSFPATKQI